MMNPGSASELEWVRCPVCDGDQTRLRFVKQGFSVVRCLACRVHYVNPRPTVDRLASLYREEYFAQGRPESSGSQHLQHGAMKLATARLRLRLLRKFTAKGLLVDVGCGGGFFVQAAGEAGWSAIGLEPSAAAVRQGMRERLLRRERPVRIVAGRLEEAPVARGRFDAVTMLDVLEHVAHPRHFLDEARNLLAPGGVLVVETPNMAGWAPRLMGSRHPWVRPLEHLTYFTPPALRLLLERAGFRVRHLQGRAYKVLTLDYVLSLTAATNPRLTALTHGTVGWWRGLRQRTFTVPLALLVAVAEPNET